jgi:predicted porin
MQCGREQPDDNKHWTYHYNAYLQYHATKELRFDLDALYLAQETVVATDSNRDKGFGAYLLADYAIDPKWGAYGRYAFVGDRSADGAFTGAKQSIHQATAGLRYRMSDDLRLRLEYQLDGHKPTGLTDSYSQAVALEVNYRFPIGI